MHPSGTNVRNYREKTSPTIACSLPKILLVLYISRLPNRLGSLISHHASRISESMASSKSKLTLNVTWQRLLPMQPFGLHSWHWCSPSGFRRHPLDLKLILSCLLRLRASVGNICDYLAVDKTASCQLYGWEQPVQGGDEGMLCRVSSRVRMSISMQNHLPGKHDHIFVRSRMCGEEGKHLQPKKGRALRGIGGDNYQHSQQRREQEIRAGAEGDHLLCLQLR